MGRRSRKSEQKQNEAMLPVERRAAGSLAGIFSLRMLGLFMLLPVLSLYAESFTGSTPLLMGIALGIYGLTQSLFQIPFGMLSDRWGRKNIILIGLLLFAFGSVVAALAESIELLILGRAIQGTGAIAAATTALLADLTREEHRTRAMAIFGMSIGLSFTAAIVLGPVLNGWVGVSGIFWITAVLALAGIGVLYLVVPTPAHSHTHLDADPIPAQFMEVMKNGQLFRLNLGIFMLHLILTAVFVAVPIGLRDSGLPTSSHWMVYLGVVIVAIGIMVPMVIAAESRARMKEMFLTAIALVAASQFLLGTFSDSMWGIVFALVVFFGGFNLLEALLPSLIAKMAPADKKGTAMGVYSSSQFMGAFMGGLLGGALMYEDTGVMQIAPVFWAAGVLALIWIAVAVTMKRPGLVKTKLLRVGKMDQAKAQETAKNLQAIAGVVEAVVIAKEGVAYLKVEQKGLDEAALEVFVVEYDA